MDDEAADGASASGTEGRRGDRRKHEACSGWSTLPDDARGHHVRLSSKTGSVEAILRLPLASLAHKTKVSYGRTVVDFARDRARVLYHCRLVTPAGGGPAR